MADFAATFSAPGFALRRRFGVMLATAVFTAASAAAQFAPSDLSGLALWLDGADLDGDGAAEGLLEAGLVGSADVATWADKSGNSNDCTQGNGSLRPTYTPNVRNGHAVVRFDGSGQQLVISTPLSGNTHTIYAVLINNDGTWGSVPVGSSDTTSGYLFHGTTQAWFETDSAANDTENLTDGVWNIIAGIHTGTQIGAFVNSVGMTTVNDTGAFTPDRIGMVMGYSQGDMDGDIAEIVSYSRALNASERTQVEAYLAAKWAIDRATFNDGPWATNTSQTKTYTEDDASVALDDIVTSDPDSGDQITATLTLADPSAGSITATSGNGETYNAGTGVWTITNSPATVNAALAAAAFIPAADYDVNTTIAVNIADGGEDGAQARTGTINLNVTAVNDQPSATNLTQTKSYTEDAPSVALDDIVVTDPDTGEQITATLTLANTATGALSASSGNGESYNAGSGVWTVTGSVSAVNAALAAVTFVPAANNDASTTVSTNIADGGENGSTPQTGTITLNVTPVNDAPTATNTGQSKTVAEDGAGAALDPIVVTDPDTGEIVTATLTLADPAAGALSAASGNGESYNAGTGVWTVTGSVATVNAALAAITFTPSADRDTAATIGVNIADGGEDGATPATGTITLNITAVNDAPTATNTGQSKTVTEDGAAIALDPIVVTDPDTGEIVTATLTLADPAAGALSAASGNGESYNAGTGVWTVTGSVATVNAALAAITFTPSADRDTGTTVTVNIADGGEDGATPATGTITLNITAVNDAPTATNTTQSKSYAFGATTVALDDIVVSDPDTGEQITATLTLAQPATGGLSAATGNGESYDSATGVWTVAGSLSAVNAALAGVAFEPASGNTADSTVTVDIADGGEDGAAAVSGMISLTVGNVPPTLATNAGATVDAGDSFTIGGSALSATDADNSAGELTYTLTAVPAAGSLTLSGAVLSVGDSFTQADIDAGLLHYEHDGGAATSDSFSFTISDSAGGTIAETTFPITINQPPPPTDAGMPALVISVAPIPGDRDTPAVGDEIAYLITVENTGDGATTNVVVTVPLPENTEFVSAKLSANATAQNATLSAEVVDGSVVITIGDVAAGEQVGVVLTLRALDSGSVTLSATVASDDQPATSPSEPPPDVEVEDAVDTIVTTVRPMPLCGLFGFAPLLILAVLTLMRTQRAVFRARRR